MTANLNGIFGQHRNLHISIVWIVAYWGKGRDVIILQKLFLLHTKKKFVKIQRKTRVTQTKIDLNFQIR